MKLIYRGKQEKVIGELATALGYSPTDLAYKLMEDMHSIIYKTIDAQDAQEILNGNKNERED